MTIGFRSSISSEDVEKLASAYGDKNRGLSLNFVDNVRERLYTEWCMEHRDYMKDPYDASGARCKFLEEHKGEWFTNFVNDETHYELERRGYHWDEPRKRFNRVDNWIYNTVRDQVLRGLAICAIDFFKDCLPGDERNLRQDLSAFTKAGYLNS